MSRRTRNRLIWAAVFGVTMGVFEAAVVVYLRRIVYPDGFSFPLRRIDTHIAVVELVREFASIVMILSVAALAGGRAGEGARSFGRACTERLAYFMYVFGIWDVIYYVFLKLALDWPGSILETDILFLIPVPWTGPVLAPVLVSVVMISAAVVTVWLEERKTPLRVTWRNLGVEIVCGLVIIVSFCLDWREVASGGMPRPFAWWLFLPGLVAGTGVFVHEATMSFRGGRAAREASPG